MPLSIRIGAIAALLLSSSALAGCSPPGPKVDEKDSEERVSVDDVTRESQEAIDTARQLFEQERAELSETIRADLDVLGMRVSALHEKFQDQMADFDEATSEQWRMTLSDLDARKASLERQFETFKESSSEAMGELLVGLNETRDSLVEAVETAETTAEKTDETEYEVSEKDTTVPAEQP